MKRTWISCIKCGKLVYTSNEYGLYCSKCVVGEYRK